MKKFLIVVCVIVVVCLLGYAGQYMNEDVVPTNTVSNNEKQNVSSSNKNNSNTSSKKEEVVEDKKEEEVKENEENTEKENDEDKNEPVVEENSISSEDKAIDLAKKEYGNSSDVYFKIEQIVSNGVYIISVRDNETTEAYAWYNVDVNKGSVK